MEYRKLPHGTEEISVIGLGAGSLSGTVEGMAAVLNAAIENGINYFDMAPSAQQPFYACAEAFRGRRDKIITQMHFGAVYKGGKYGWSRKLDEMAKGHYHKLPVHADACIQCGHCEARCPFHIKQESRMQKINQYFSTT